MKKLTVALSFISVALFAATAVAAPPKKPVKERFYNMGEMTIKGDVRGPAATWVSDRTRARFGSLANMPRKSFFPAMFSTSKQIIKL